MEEFLAVVVVIFPGVFAIQDDADNMRAFGALVFQLSTNIFKTLDKICGGGFTGNTGISKAYFIRNDAITEKDCQLIAVCIRHIVRAIEIISLLDGFSSIPRKTIQVEAFRKNRFTGSHPGVAAFDHKRHNGLRHGTFARPQALRRLAKIFLIDGNTALQMS